MKVVTTEEMRLMEERAAEAGVSPDALMESAGLAVARNAAQRLDGVRSKRVVVLVGPGNNGGDGMVAARYLADWGAVVTLYMTTARRRDDKFEECRERRCRVVEASEDRECWQLGSYVSLADLVLDAMLGVGARPGLEPPILPVVEAVAQMKTRANQPLFVAVDVPTGIDADAGERGEFCFPADVTLALGAPKRGLLQFPGAAAVGELQTLPIGLPDGADDGLPIDLADAALVGPLLPARPGDAHKGSFGGALVVGGSRAFAGAPALAAAAAYRAGAGIVRIAAPESVSRIAAAQLLEPVHTPLAETPEGGASPGAAGAAREALDAAASAVVGPGLGAGEASASFLRALLLTPPAIAAPVVLDADALNVLAGAYDWPSQLAAHAVLTPHPGEMGRLLALPVHEIQRDRTAIASEAARRWGQVVVLKGAHTVVAAPDGRAALSPFANPALATGGSGDVLAGVIGGLLAQGMERYEAAVAGVHLHGAAAERWRAANGSGGMLASDLLALLPRVTEDARGG